MPATVNITLENDADFFQQFQYTLADGVTPISIAGATFVFAVRRSLSDPNTLFKVTSNASSSGQIQIVDAVNGIFGLWIAKAQILAAPLGTWYHSLVVTIPVLTGAFPPTISTPLWSGQVVIANGAAR